MGDELDIIVQIICCISGTLAFAVTMKAAKHTMIYIAIGGLISAGMERILSLHTNDFFACFTAMVALSLFCEIIARIIKEPTTVILMPSTIPLLPGSSIYYTMLYAINGDNMLMKDYAYSTVLAGLGIALGAVLSSAIVKIILEFKRKS